MDFFKAASLIEHLQTWNPDELEFLYNYLYARLTQIRGAAQPPEEPEKTSWAAVVGAPIPDEVTPLADPPVEPVAAEPDARIATEDGVQHFCGNRRCPCVFTFRSDNDPVRERYDLIRAEQLYITGWVTELHTWEDVRKLLWDFLRSRKVAPTQTYIDKRGFGFLTFSNHNQATRALKALAEHVESPLLTIGARVNFAANSGEVSE